MYLKQNIKLAPYIWNWYAWSHLISPHTAAMNIVERHIKIMESFVAYPDMHYEAINSRGMIGGPFINLSPGKKAEVLNLLQETKIECATLIELNSLIKEFDITLQNNANGTCLEQFYSLLPAQLQGIVELVYDSHNHPQIRFIEPLVYWKYYNHTAQSITLSEISSDNRPFCLSTPHIHQEDTLKLKIPFSSTVIDALMRMKFISGNPKDLIHDLNIKNDDLDFYYSLFTETAPLINNTEFKESGIRIRYLGHACILLQSQNISILIDPVLGYNYDGQQTDRFTYMDLPETIDYVLITHNHQDHFLLEVLLQLRYKIKKIIVPASNDGSLVDPSMKLALQYLGFKNVFVLNQFDEIPIPELGKITALPFFGEHGDLDIKSKLAYHISISDVKFMFLADSNNLDNQLYDTLFSYTGPIDMLFIGMECVGAPVSWLYGPLFSKPLSRDLDKSRRLSGSNCNKAWEIVKKSGCKEVCIYAMGMEPWLSYIMAVHYKPDSLPIVESNKLIELCLKENIKAQRLYGKNEWLFPKGKYEVKNIQTEIINYAV